MQTKSIASAIALTLMAISNPLFAENLPKEIKLDYAYYSPSSLLIKSKGWLEEEFSASSTQVKWVFSRGSNNSLEFLNGGASNFALTSSISSLVARSNGQPVKIIYTFSWAEPSTIEVPANSPLQSVADLKGKKIAVTKGTDPYFYLLRALALHGLDVNDVEIVHLQHPEGKTALEQGRVDAWVGIDPHLSAAQLGGSRTLYTNPDFSLAAVLNTNEEFLENYPDAVEKVIHVYERARQWIIDNPDEIVTLLAEETKLSREVAAKQIGRADYSYSTPGEYNIKAIEPVVPLLNEAGLLRRGADPEAALATLIDDNPAKSALGK